MKLIAMLVALMLLFQGSGCLVVGPQPSVMDWELPPGGDYSFNATLVLAEAPPGSGLELGFGEGPYRAGFILVFNDTCGAVYLMAGDQNSWHMLGYVEPGMRLEMGIGFYNGSIHAWLAGREVEYNYSGPPGFEYFRIAVIGVREGVSARILDLEVSVDGSRIGLGVCEDQHPPQGGGGENNTGTNNTGGYPGNETRPPSGGEGGTGVPVYAVLVAVSMAIVVSALLWLRIRGRRLLGSRSSSGEASY
jgi:hypothetical protein